MWRVFLNSETLRSLLELCGNETQAMAKEWISPGAEGGKDAIFWEFFEGACRGETFLQKSFPPGKALSCELYQILSPTRRSLRCSKS